MNRSLTLGAVGCVLGFSILVTTFSLAESKRERSVRLVQQKQVESPALYDSQDDADSQWMPASYAPVSPSILAEQRLNTLVGEYVAPWRSWADSRSFRYSRVGPRPAPPIQTHVELVSAGAIPSTNFQLATITITVEDQPQAFACVVDDQTQQVSFFVEGRWQTSDQWLAKAPLPYGGTTDARAFRVAGPMR